jgi:DHA2 family multidrug resistance protein
VREQVHSNLLGQHVTDASGQVAHLLAKLSAHFSNFGLGAALPRSLGTLSGIVQRESNVLAYIDAFWLTFIFAVAGLLFTALITRPPSGPLTPPASSA